MWKEENKENKQDKENKKTVKIVPAISPKRNGSISWDEYFMGVAALSAMRSKDPHTQVGCCIVGAKNRIASVGYNGLPFGCDDDEYPWNRHSDGISENETKYPYVVHSELNAILNYRGESLEGAKMYVTMFPCCECAKAIIQSGIQEVIYRDEAYLYSPSGIAATRMFKSAGVSVRQFGGDKRLAFLHAEHGDNGEQEAEDSLNPITLQDVEHGYKNGTVKLIDSPYGDGTVCKIGEHWFYFGGAAAGACSVEEFKKYICEDWIIRQVFEALEDMRYDPTFEDEYAYYQSILAH